MKKFSKTKTYGLLIVWVIAATAIGIYLTNWLIKPKDQESIAPLAEIRQCGPTTITSEQEKKILAQWVIQGDRLTADAKSALARNIQALPTQGIKALEQRNFKFALDRGEAPYTCLIYDKAPSNSNPAPKLIRSAENCLRAAGKDGTALVLGRPQLVMPDGKPRGVYDKDLIDEVTLPTVFWSLLEGLYETSDVTSQDKPSISNISSRIKRYVLGGYKFDPDEKTYYLRTFGAGGTETPSFATRTLVLTASTLYCSQESYTQLQKHQPEAIKRFMSIYGCALGKPWHMADGEFSGICPTLAKASSGGEK